MRHSPESADDRDDRDDPDTADLLDERFRELVVRLAPRVPRPPVESVHREVRRRRVRNRIAVSVAALVMIAGGVSLAGVVGDDSPAHPEQAAAPVPPSTPSTSPTALSMETVGSATPSAAPAAPAATVAALTDELYPGLQDFVVIPGVYENWRVTDTRPAVGDDFGPCSSLTFSGLGAVEARERLYRHDGDGGASVLLVRYADEQSAALAADDLRKGLDGACPATNQPNLDADGRPNIKSLDKVAPAWRTTGVVNGVAQYSDYGIVRSGQVVAVVNESVIGPRAAPPAEPILHLVETVRERLGKSETGP